MLTLKCLAQGSSGNCWLLETETECLILDAGIPVMNIKRGLDYNITKVAGVVITHVHADHSLSADKLAQMGLKVFKPYEVTGKLERQFGSFNIKAFTVPHDGTPCFGFLITVNGHRMVYITDFEYCEYTFRNFKLNTMLIECNYQDKYLESDTNNHKILGHCEFETCKEFILTNCTSALQNVIVTHMGQGTVNGKEVVDEIQKCLKKPCSVSYATPQQTYELRDNRCPF